MKTARILHSKAMSISKRKKQNDDEIKYINIFEDNTEEKIKNEV